MQMLENLNRRDHLGKAGVDGKVMLLKMPSVIDAVSLDISLPPAFRRSFLPPSSESDKLKRRDIFEKIGFEYVMSL